MEASPLSLLGRIVPRTDGKRVEKAAVRVRQALERIGADAGYIGIPSRTGRAVHVLRVTPESQNFVELGFSIDAPYPLAAAIRHGVPLFVGDNASLACMHPGLVRLRAEDHACATVPLLAGDGTLLGAINVTFEDPHEFSETERLTLEALARECAEDLQG